MSKANRWKGITENRVHMGMFDFDVIVLVGDYKTALAYVDWKFKNKDVNLKPPETGYVARGVCFFRRAYVAVIWV